VTKEILTPWTITSGALTNIHQSDTEYFSKICQYIQSALDKMGDDKIMYTLHENLRPFLTASRG
jgi:hypothetical protein